MIQNAVLETATHHVPIFVRAPGNHSKYRTDLDLALGAFLVAYGPGSSFGYGDCWFDHCWQWQEAYDLEFGEPIGPAVMSADAMMFQVRYISCNVVVDT